MTTPGLCEDTDYPDLWFSTEPSDLTYAKAVCRRCPIRMSCYEGAQQRGERAGVWGGVDFNPKKERTA